MKKYLLLLSLLMLSLFMSACSTIKSTASGITHQERIQFDANGTKLIMSNRVVRGDQVVSVHPNQNLEALPTALFLPFGVTQDTTQPEALSQGLSRIMWQQFLNEKVFSVCEYARVSPPYRVEDALSYARQKNAQFLVGGYITYFFDGGQRADTQMSVILEVYDVANGNLLWSIAHAGLMPYETTRDYIVLQVETAMPFDPAYAVASVISNDMAKLLKMWTDPESNINSRKSGGRSF